MKKFTFITCFSFLFVGVLFLDSCINGANSCSGVKNSPVTLRGNFEVTDINLNTGYNKTNGGFQSISQNEQLDSIYQFYLQINPIESQIVYHKPQIGYYSMQACSPLMIDSTRHTNNISKIDVVAMTNVVGNYAKGDTITSLMIANYVGDLNLIDQNRIGQNNTPKAYKLNTSINSQTELQFKIVTKLQNGISIVDSTVLFKVSKN